MADNLTDYRRHKRLRIKIPIVVKGLDRDDRPFSETTETLNGSIGGVGFFLEHEPKAASDLVISFFHNLSLFHIRTRVRHITPLDSAKLIGVQFRGVRGDAPPDVEL